MNKWFKEEINLCKLIAEKYRKEIESRQYFYNNHLIGIQWSEEGQSKAEWAIPLWTISDCLEFLKEKEFRFILHHYDVKEYHLGYGRGTGQWSDITPCKTPLEACLKAVLAVLEEGK